MRAPLIKLTLGDYLYRMPGFLESVNVTVDQGSTWEIENGKQLPHFIDIATSFKPIPNALPQRGKKATNQSKFIGEPLWNRNNNQEIGV
jgi:hypothetical protein